ncbi:MAG: hypothetical protein NVS4B11_19640 [Ktedonobacteraceae bacterium]
MKCAPTRDIIGLFVVTRLILMMVTYFGYVLLTASKYSSTPVDTATFFTLWNHWDATRYLAIAQHGYQTPYDLAFFPLFPLLIAVFSYPLGGWSYLLVGTLLSNGALLAALFVLYQLAADSLSEQVGRRTLLYLCIFPTAFFFFTAYNESLFLLLTAGTFLALRRQKWWLAGLLGLLAALTRSSGIFLVVPYLYELWLVRENIFSRIRNSVFGLLPILLIPLGTSLYCIYCWHVSGNPFAFASVQIHWARQPSWPWQGIWQALFEFFWNQPFGSFFEVHTLLDLSATLAFILLTIAGWRILRTSYTVWAALLLFFTSLSSSLGQHDALISNQRFVLELFPCFITLAALGVKHPRLHQAVMIAFPSLLATLSLIFVMNLWMV